MPKTKRVSFPVDDDCLSNIVCILENREELSSDDLQALWFTKDDYAYSRASVSAISMENHRHGLNKNLDRSFCEKSKAAQVSLNRWCTEGDSLRGLERIVNKEHGDIRYDAQFKAIMDILAAQDDMRQFDKGRVDPGKIRKIAQKETKVSRHFARMMGKADEFAVHHERNDSVKSDSEITDITVGKAMMKHITDAMKDVIKRDSRRKALKKGSPKRLPRIS